MIKYFAKKLILTLKKQILNHWNSESPEVKFPLNIQCHSMGDSQKQYKAPWESPILILISTVH